MGNEKNEDAEIETLMGDDERSKNFRHHIITQPKFVAKIKYFLKIWDALGLLDPLKN